MGNKLERGLEILAKGTAALGVGLVIFEATAGGAAAAEEDIKRVGKSIKNKVSPEPEPPKHWWNKKKKGDK